MKEEPKREGQVAASWEEQRPPLAHGHLTGDWMGACALSIPPSPTTDRRSRQISLLGQSRVETEPQEGNGTGTAGSFQNKQAVSDVTVSQSVWGRSQNVIPGVELGLRASQPPFNNIGPFLVLGHTFSPRTFFLEPCWSLQSRACLGLRAPALPAASVTTVPSLPLGLSSLYANPGGFTR